MPLIVTLLLLVQAPGVQSGDVRAEVREILSRMADCTLPELWALTRELERRGREALEAVQDGLKSRSPKVRLGCAKALAQLGDPEGSEAALRAIADSAAGADVRQAALVLLRTSLEDGLAPVLARIAREDADPVIRLEAARTLFEVTLQDTDQRKQTAEARDIMERFLRSSDKDLQDRAAVALGEIGYVESLTKRILAQLAGEPTDLGRRAWLILEIERLARESERSDNIFRLDEERKVLQEQRLTIEARERRIKELEQQVAVLRAGAPARRSEANPLLAWVLDTVRASYVDAGAIDDVDLYVGAAKGMVRALDRFSAFMDVEEMQRFTEGISGSYTGIGAQISQDQDSGLLVILRPMRGGPARAAGLQAQDRILQIDGKDTKGLQMEDVVPLLKGESGSEVQLLVHRRGWKEPRTFAITRREITVEPVHYRLLAGGIAYVRIDQFGDRAFMGLLEALTAMRGQGFQGIILDLRGNPGGLLNEAVQVVDLFVAEQSRPIVTQRGPIGEKKELSHNLEPQYLVEPLAVLIDRASASASEIVAGALQDFDNRAVLVGQKTFGKGSVQRVFGLPPEAGAFVGGRAGLRLTVQYYYLPSDRCIHRRGEGNENGEAWGVTPDIVVDPPQFPLWKLHEFDLLGERAELRDYVQRLCDPAGPHAAVVADLLVNGDGGDAGRYPGFDDFMDAISGESKLSRAGVRLVLRAALRRAHEDGGGDELACDFQDDVQLQRGILEVLKRLAIDPVSLPAYAGFAAAAAGAAEGGM